MLDCEDLLKGVNERFYDKQVRILKQNIGSLDLTTRGGKWLAASYVYAIHNNLKEYQARSFASELTLFITGQIINTDVELVYREDWIDSYFYDKFNQMKKKHDNKQTKEFWHDFINSMMQFYTSNESWKYQRVSKYLQFRINDTEKEIFESIPKQKPKEKFLYLMDFFNFELVEVEYEREIGELNRTFSINLTVGEYERFMEIIGDSKTQKFLNMLYYWYTNFL